MNSTQYRDNNNCISTQQATHSKRCLFLLYIMLLLKLLSGNSGIGRHAMVLGRFLDILLDVNPLVGNRWVNDLYL